MTNVLLFVIIVMLVAAILLLISIRLKSSNNSNLKSLHDSLRNLESQLERSENRLKDEFERTRRETANDARNSREELSLGLDRFGTTIEKQLSVLTQNTEDRLERIRETVYSKLVQIQKENHESLDEMRKTVDEKLESTLQKRLGESFKLISERLENVHRGLGEMQELANGVGDLKRVLSNVKTRGTWGEIQLGSLLEQVLTAEQYEQNAAVTNGKERVEFAIKLPGQDNSLDSPVYLPIDSKFPIEDYQRLVDAQHAADVDAANRSTKQLERQIKNCAAMIRDKYIQPPYTTDFAIMFLPIEGLYAEIVKQPGLTELLQRDYRIVVAGPTTLLALLNSLQMGFRTLAIQERSSEVWALLGAVKAEFSKFGDSLAKVQKKLQEASNSITQAETRSRVITKKLTRVEELPTQSTHRLGPHIRPDSLPKQVD